MLTLAFYCLQLGKSTTSGFLCGLAFGLKLYGGPFLLYFVVKRNWKAVAGMLAASALAAVTAIVLFGWGDVHFYATQILPRSLEGEVITSLRRRKWNSYDSFAAFVCIEPGSESAPAFGTRRSFSFSCGAIRNRTK